ncbi:MAG TPA: ribosome-associated translation inhibitor RaiA [Bryobacteraceae bacterium]|nr:ribosome-associated translation inhibitor RaiA [Bryobacteraceae bacterium]
MKITYTGRQVELAPAQTKKLEARFSKIGKLLDGRRECEAHVILSLERHLHHAEATVNYYNHQLAGLGSSTDLFTAIHSAAEKLEKQALKTREKWRDTKRAPHEEAAEPKAAPAAAAKPAKVRGRKVVAKTMAELPEAEQRVYKVDHHKKRKPMTAEEAVLDLDKTRDYVVYRDADTGRTVVLIRRRDGHLDMVEA